MFHLCSTPQNEKPISKNILRIFFISANLFLLINLLAAVGYSQIVISIEGIEGELRCVTKFNEKFWVGTDRGLYFIGPDETKASKVILPYDGEISFKSCTFYKFYDKLWITSGSALYHIDKNDFKINPDGGTDGDIMQTREFDGRMWFVTNQGLFFKNKEADSVISKKWDRKDFCYDASINEVKKCSLEYFMDRLWVGTREGLFRVDPGNPTMNEPVLKFPITDTEIFDNEFFLLSATSDAYHTSLYQLNVNSSREVRDAEACGGSGTFLKNLDSSLLVGMNLATGSYLLEKNEKCGSLHAKINTLISDAGKIEYFGGRYWILVDCGRLKYLDKSQGTWAPQSVNLDAGVAELKKTANKLWIVTDRGMFYIEKDRLELTKFIESSNIRNLMGEEDDLWFQLDQSRTFRIDTNGTLEASLKPPDSILRRMLSTFIPKDYLFEGSADFDIHRKIFDPVKKEFTFVSEEDKTGFSYQVLSAENCENYQKESFTNINTPYQIGGWFSQTLCVVVKSPEGIISNRANFVQTYFVIPDITKVIWLPVLLIIISTFLIFILAPYNEFCQDLLMNRFIRSICSFGLIPILLSVFPFVRRYVFKRYMNNLGNSENFLAWHDRFVYPSSDFLAENFGKKITSERKILVLGQSGIGKTSYFKHLVARYAQGDNGLLPGNIIPVFVSLSSFTADTPPEQLISNQLRNFGKMSDDTLNEWFIKQGGFLIFFDGLNEIPNDALRGKLAQFVEANWHANYICLSSQQPYPEFAGSNLSDLEIKPLSKDGIEKMLVKRLGAEEAKSVLDEFDEDTYSLYQIPRDLEFVVELKQREGTGFTLPKNRNELYARTLDPVISKWEEKGRRDYASVLYERAYQMLITKDYYVKSKEKSFPEEIINDLTNEKYRYLVKYADNSMFRHDLIKAYLASKYFLSKWVKLLGVENIEIESSGLEMLKFAIPLIGNSSHINKLMQKIIEAPSNVNSAGVLFNWLEDQHPILCVEWADNFKKAFAEAKLREITI